MQGAYVLKDKMKEPRIVRILFWIAAFICGIGSLFLMGDALVFIFIDMSGFNFGQVTASILQLVVGIFAFRWFIITLILYTRVCVIDEKGFTIISCKWFKKKYCWSDVRSIVLCDANYYTSHCGEMYDIVIRIAVRDESFGPLSTQKAYPVLALTHVEGWRTLAYTRKHFNKVFPFEFTLERYDAICRMSGLEIPKQISKKASERFSREYSFDT